uniref:Uncharacterized protein n=1 Tax=Utricularia reniformis TaxID=192314 RepID=A0A1Y0B302_9LAMI|nr:hypothetical protein AEK19_MT1605 [Utricularia reniformis]ART31790.1 hypothetical protein AEK19_MT1605 [Utricularia reniformis]
MKNPAFFFLALHPSLTIQHSKYPTLEVSDSGIELNYLYVHVIHPKPIPSFY